MCSGEASHHSCPKLSLRNCCTQAGWPPPIATQDSGAAESGATAAAAADPKSAACIFDRAPPALLTALRQLLAAMFELQRADDPSGFAKVPIVR